MTTKLLKKSPQILTALFLTLFVSTEATAAPVANPDRLHTTVGVSKTVGVLWNDRGRGIYVSKVKPYTAKGGRVYKVAGGKIHYTPKAGFRGTDSFWYQVTDANGRTNSSKVVVNVNGGDHSASNNSHFKPVHHWKRRNHWQRQNWKRQNWQRQNHWRHYNNKPRYNLQWSRPGFSITYSKPGGVQAQFGVPQHQYVQPQYSQPRANWQPHWGQGGGAPVGRPDTYSTRVSSGQMPLWVLANDQGQGLKVLSTNQWTQQGGTAWVMNNHTGSYIMYKPKPGFAGVDTVWYVLRDANGRTNSTKATISVW